MSGIAGSGSGPVAVLKINRNFRYLLDGVTAFRSVLEDCLAAVPSHTVRMDLVRTGFPVRSVGVCVEVFPAILSRGCLRGVVSSDLIPGPTIRAAYRS